MEHIGILGIGAIGSTISCLFQQKQARHFYYFNRSVKPKIEVQFPHELISFSVDILTNLNKAIKLDWLIICLKAYHYKDAEEIIKGLIHPNTKVVLIRNGINLSDSIRHICSSDKILPCSIDCPIESNPDGTYVALKYPNILIPESKLSTGFRALFSKKLALEIVPNFQSRNWEKLIESAGLAIVMVHINGVCKNIIEQQYVEVYKSIIEESIQVAFAAGIKLEVGFRDRLIQKLYEYPPEKGSSMLQDFRNNKPLEWMAKSGIILDLAKKYDIHLPVHTRLAKTIIKDI